MWRVGLLAAVSNSAKGWVEAIGETKNREDGAPAAAESLLSEIRFGLAQKPLIVKDGRG